MRITFSKIILPSVLALFIILPAGYSDVFAESKMFTYLSSDRNGPFQVTLPDNWKQSVLEESSSTLYSYKGPVQTVFSIKVFRDRSLQVSDIQRAEFISLLEKDNHCVQILDTDDYVTFTGSKSRISVYEYHEPKNRNKSVLRKYFLKTGAFIYVISCSAPIPSFYNNEAFFSSALSSLSFSGSSFTKAEKPAPKKELTPDESLKNPQKDKTGEESVPQTEKNEDSRVDDSAENQSENQPEVKSTADTAGEAQDNKADQKTDEENTEEKPKEPTSPYSSTVTIP